MTDIVKEMWHFAQQEIEAVFGWHITLFRLLLAAVPLAIIPPAILLAVINKFFEAGVVL